MGTPTREHDHSADDATLNALRHLRQPWRGWEIANGVVRVQATDGVVVRLTVVHAEPEKGFAVRRVAADFEKGAVRPVRAVAGFEGGSNDVVIFAGESWLTRLVRRPEGFDAATADDDLAAETHVLVTHGQPMDRPEHAEASCTTTDAALVASPRGLVWLVRLGDMPDELEVVTDGGVVREFLEQRGYRG